MRKVSEITKDLIKEEEINLLNIEYYAIDLLERKIARIKRKILRCKSFYTQYLKVNKLNDSNYVFRN
jgi:hypothetical protein